MYYATKIKMRDKDKDNLLEISEIYLEDRVNSANSNWYTRENIHNWLKDNNDTGAKVDISPFPNLVHATSINGDKYVKSEPDKYQKDNLLNVPRY